jgi:chromate transporter
VTEPPKKAELIGIAGVFFRTGNFTFGGGSATVAALQREMVVKRGWLEQGEFALSYALSRITPGTNLLAFCTSAGWLMRGWQGALVAVLAASIPSCLLVYGVTAGFDSVSHYPAMQIATGGALAASVGILLASFWQLLRPYVNRRNLVQSAVIVGGSIVLSLVLHLSAISVFALAAVVGWFWKEPASA